MANPPGIQIWQHLARGRPISLYAVPAAVGDGLEGLGRLNDILELTLSLPICEFNFFPRKKVASFFFFFLFIYLCFSVFFFLCSLLKVIRQIIIVHHDLERMELVVINEPQIRIMKDGDFFRKEVTDHHANLRVILIDLF